MMIYLLNSSCSPRYGDVIVFYNFQYVYDTNFKKNGIQNCKYSMSRNRLLFSALTDGI